MACSLPQSNLAVHISLLLVHLLSRVSHAPDVFLIAFLCFLESRVIYSASDIFSTEDLESRCKIKAYAGRSTRA